MSTDPPADAGNHPVDPTGHGAGAAVPQGADLARQVLAQAKRDARDRARGRRPTADPHRSWTGAGDRTEPGRAGTGDAGGVGTAGAAGPAGGAA
ncbi:hypothetical protein ND747_18700, partial [Frankia sp. R82]|nr:hypothetical protein [Frankia sp. R82]